jgi:LmbE family N-acetylglucosaminyl deacetylase
MQPIVDPSVGALHAGNPKSVAVIVAHPDDETLWAGGTILCHPAWDCHIITICRASDPDRAPRFSRALQELGAAGDMGDLDDGPEQRPLKEYEVQRTVLGLLPSWSFDLIITHNSNGEYTRHLRHEEVGRAVISLWHAGNLATDELWTFAYEDGGKRYLPRPIEAASLYSPLPEAIWQRKYAIITGTYGFPPDGFEAQATPRAESFWRFTESSVANAWLEHGALPL